MALRGSAGCSSARGEFAPGIPSGAEPLLSLPAPFRFPSGGGNKFPSAPGWINPASPQSIPFVPLSPAHSWRCGNRNCRPEPQRCPGGAGNRDVHPISCPSSPHSHRSPCSSQTSSAVRGLVPNLPFPLGNQIQLSMPSPGSAPCPWDEHGDGDGAWGSPDAPRHCSSSLPMVVGS